MAEADAPAVWAIFESALRYQCEPEVVRRRIGELVDDERHLLMVWEGDDARPLGFLHAQRYDTLHDEGGWNVIALAVEPAMQGRGIGRALLEALETTVAARGGIFVRLNSRVERIDAHGFYEHLGYVCDKQQKRFKKMLCN